jgi:hypothetical protein
MGARFEHLVDKYSGQIKAAEISGSTDVVLIFHWTDEAGIPVSANRESLVPSIKVEGFGAGEAAQNFARSMFVGTILDNLKRRILDTPDGPILLPGWPAPVQLRDIELEIS